jgi:hypothetical protein
MPLLTSPSFCTTTSERVYIVSVRGTPPWVHRTFTVFQQALAESRKRYPTREFESFAAVIRQYVDATREDEMLHRCVVRAVNGLVEYLQSEGKRVPEEVLLEAERLECLLFFGYDPHFDGDEPPNQ